MAHDPSKTAVTYADAGVDIDRANRTKKRIKYLAHKTFTRSVLSEIGGFGGLFAVDKAKWVDPILVSSVDGVGTKLKIAFEMDVHHTIGADLVNHCVNDIAVQGATPLFFMDYLATGRIEPEVTEKVIEGLADASLRERLRFRGRDEILKRIRENMESIRMSRQLATICCEAPIEVSAEVLRYRRGDRQVLGSLCHELGLMRVLEEIPLAQPTLFPL